MNTNRIRFTISGAGDNGDDLRVGDFLKQIAAFKKALDEADRLVSGGKTLEYRIVELSHSSPIDLTLEARSIVEEEDFAVEVIETFYDGVTAIQQGEKVPDKYDVVALQVLREMTELIPKRVSGIQVARNGSATPVEKSFRTRIDTLLGPDEYEIGSVTGMLHHVSLHGPKYVFTVYPTSNEPPLRCYFPTSLRVQVVEAVDRYVEVFGQLRYKRVSPFPYAMSVHEIEVFPPEHELPTLDDLRGIAPNTTGGKRSEEFIRDLRNEWL